MAKAFELVNQFRFQFASDNYCQGRKPWAPHVDPACFILLTAGRSIDDHVMSNSLSEYFNEDVNTKNRKGLDPLDPYTIDRVRWEHKVFVLKLMISSAIGNDGAKPISTPPNDALRAFTSRCGGYL